MFTNYIAKQSVPGQIDTRIAGHYLPQSMIVEQYRNICAYLGSIDGKHFKSILITSANRNEGKSITAANLAVTMAQDKEKKVLLLNADLRAPSLEKMFGLPAQKGLSDFLNKQAELSEILQPTEISTLSVLPSGTIPGNPVDLLSGLRMKELISFLEHNFDHVLIDSPAILPYADARILSPLADGVLLVAEARRTRREVVWRAQEQINAVKANLLGVVLTKVEYYIPEYIHRHL